MIWVDAVYIKIHTVGSGNWNQTRRRGNGKNGDCGWTGLIDDGVEARNLRGGNQLFRESTMSIGLDDWERKKKRRESGQVGRT